MEDDEVSAGFSRLVDHFARDESDFSYGDSEGGIPPPGPSILLPYGRPADEYWTALEPFFEFSFPGKGKAISEAAKTVAMNQLPVEEINNALCDSWLRYHNQINVADSFHMGHLARHHKLIHTAQFFYDYAKRHADARQRNEITHVLEKFYDLDNQDRIIQKFLEREVYVGDRLVGRIVGERHHPNKDRVRSMRLELEPDVAEEYMRKPAEMVPLSKELLENHKHRRPGEIKLSKSMRELQRRWTNTVRIDEKLYAPDELLDRVVLDMQGTDIGIVVGLLKVKRTFRGIVVRVRPNIRRNYGLAESVNIPIQMLARTRERLDELILSRDIEKILSLPSYVQINSEGAELKTISAPIGLRIDLTTSEEIDVVKISSSLREGKTKMKTVRIREKIKAFLADHPRNFTEILEHINSTMRHGTTSQQLENVLSMDKDIIKIGRARTTEEITEWVSANMGVGIDSAEVEWWATVNWVQRNFVVGEAQLDKLWSTPGYVIWPNPALFGPNPAHFDWSNIIKKGTEVEEEVEEIEED